MYCWVKVIGKKGMFFKIVEGGSKGRRAHITTFCPGLIAGNCFRAEVVKRNGKAVHVKPRGILSPLDNEQLDEPRGFEGPLKKAKERRADQREQLDNRRLCPAHYSKPKRRLETTETT